ncbi:MAG: hypothetical protein M3Y56_14505 [Armatimonadota bacterium]|nr:hypothetical protein [Armatimonadota bacterium]
MPNPLEQLSKLAKQYYTIEETLSHLTKQLETVESRISEVAAELTRLRFEQLDEARKLEVRIAVLEESRKTLSAEVDAKVVTRLAELSIKFAEAQVAGQNPLLLQLQQRAEEGKESSS